MNENEIILTANCIKALAGKPDSDELIQHLLKQMCTPSKESYPQPSASNVPTQSKKRPARIYSKQNANFWIFTKKEIDKMPQKYKKFFITSEQRVFYRIKPTGVYEARYKRKAEGIKIEISALTLEELKLKFIQALHDCITGTKTSKRKKTPENTLFMSYVYTFITRAKEAGCNQEIVMLWAGHSFDKDVKTSAVDRGYTDYSMEYMRSEAQKIDYNF